MGLVVRRDYNHREGEILLSNTWKEEDGFEEECRLENWMKSGFFLADGSCERRGVWC